MRGEYSTTASRLEDLPELPPRARRIPKLLHSGRHHPGTTSACAENTCLGSRGLVGLRNYLRVRGEYGRVVKTSDAFSELPPRARRILGPPCGGKTTWGTTSACAENTLRLALPTGGRWNYLRVRGEYFIATPSAPHPRELPPRARRIPFPAKNGMSFFGTTSACAENTTLRVHDIPDSGNYLRVRGEYHHTPHNLAILAELPPRARRILFSPSRKKNMVGTTSACAENTSPTPLPPAPRGNYLRVRGEYRSKPIRTRLVRELPPRARRIRDHYEMEEYLSGTTSACAENTRD